MDIIRAATSLAEDGQSDEIELDFDTLDSATLWKLEGYLRSLNPAGAGNGNFNVQVHCWGGAAGTCPHLLPYVVTLPADNPCSLNCSRGRQLSAISHI